MTFSTNQNRQFYVAKTVTTNEPDVLGEIKLFTSADGKQVFFKHFGQGGRTRSDIIDLKNVSYAHLTKGTEMRKHLKKAVIQLNPDLNSGNPISGQDYIVRIVINGVHLPGEDNVLIKHGMVHAYVGLTAAEFYEKLADSLTKNFSRENDQYFTFTASSTGVTITEVEQPWVLGVRSQEFLDFNVYGTQVKYQGEDVNWIKGNSEGMVELQETEDYVTNGKKVADLEYFCMGERGDQYRNIGWPYVIPTKYMVDPTKEYDMIDIHYSFTDDGVCSYKSEKDITIVFDHSAVNSIVSALEDAGISVSKKETPREEGPQLPTPGEDEELSTPGENS